ncbi:MAG TPA: carboxypeptidase-like regulatory domain-containing protein, partial [Caldisericia bacterium]|nr:carboxypeptidase-like regulatory domain-containing protein [Caldisericia bacterium]
MKFKKRVLVVLIVLCFLGVLSFPTIKPAKSAISYNRNNAVTYAINHATKICDDNYYSSIISNSIPDSDCAHFVSCAIGDKYGGGGIPLGMNTSPLCGLPFYGYESSLYLVTKLDDLHMARFLGYQDLPNGLPATINIPSGFEVGDIVWYRYPVNKDLTNKTIDNVHSHITIYIGNGQVAEHSYGSCLKDSNGNCMDIRKMTCGSAIKGYGGTRSIGSYFYEEVCRVEFWKILNYEINPPSPPALKFPQDKTNVSSLTPRLEWSPVSGAKSYRLQVSDSDFSTLIISEPNITSTYYDIPAGKLKVGKTYYWKVKSVNQSESSYSQCWSFNVVSPTQTGILYGYVRNANNNALIPNATVSLNNGKSATTNSNGYYAISSLSYGTYTATVQASGYNTIQYSVTINSSSVQKDFLLSPITQTGILYGYVRNANNNAL